MKYFIVSLIVVIISVTVFFSFISLVNGKTQNIQLIYKTANSVTLKWEKKSQALGYQVRVIKVKNNKLIKKVFTKNNTRKIKDLKPNTTYKFKIRPKYKNQYGNNKSIKVHTDNIKFGFWGLNGYDTADGYNYVENNFNSTVYQVYSSGPNYNLNTLLPMVENANMKVSLNITGNYSDFDDAEGNFDITLWENALDHYFNNPDISAATQEYIDNDIVVGIMLLDDIYNFTGADPTAQELEQMACDMKSHINVMTWVREDINENLILPNGSFKFSCLDAIGLQYSTRKGSMADYITNQQQAADNLNLDIIAGLNIADGGNGSSGQQGWSGSGYYAMSANEITTYGEAMLNGMDNVIMFLMWEYDGVEHWPDGTIGSDYFNQPDLRQALYNLGKLAAE